MADIMQPSLLLTWLLKLHPRLLNQQALNSSAPRLQLLSQLRLESRLLHNAFAILQRRFREHIFRAPNGSSELPKRSHIVPVVPSSKSLA